MPTIITRKRSRQHAVEPTGSISILHRISQGSMPIMALTLAIFFILLTMSGCNTDDVAYLQYRDLNGWQRAQVLEYDLTAIDTLPGHTKASRYDMILSIRIDSNYPYTSLPLSVTIESPTSTAGPDTIQIAVPSAEKRKQSVGGLSHLTYPIRTDCTIPHACRVTLCQVSEKDTLPGITAIGLLVKRK